MKKWNYKTRKYDEFESPAEFPILELPSEEEYLSMEIQCTNCGKKVSYGDCYTSRTIHNYIGIGYPVCEDCHRRECLDEMEANKLPEEKVYSRQEIADSLGIDVENLKIEGEN